MAWRTLFQIKMFLWIVAQHLSNMSTLMLKAGLFGWSFYSTEIKCEKKNFLCVWVYTDISQEIKWIKITRIKALKYFTQCWTDLYNECYFLKWVTKSTEPFPDVQIIYKESVLDLGSWRCKAGLLYRFIILTCCKIYIQSSVFSLIPGTQKIWMKTWGCSHNNSDGEYMAGQLAASGYKITGKNLVNWVDLTSESNMTHKTLLID